MNTYEMGVFYLAEAQIVHNNKVNMDYIKIETVFINNGITLKQLIKKMALEKASGNDIEETDFCLGGSRSENPTHGSL